MRKSPRRVPSARARKAAAISVIVEDPRWREDAAALRLIRRGARRAREDAFRKTGRRSAPPPLTILLTDDARLKALNASFRGKDKPTNVLSFPAAAGRDSLGDIAIAHGVVQREARAQNKRFAEHAAHLAVHGVLHLIGYDHERASEADEMESLERAILSKLGIADPYAPRPYTGAGKAA